MREAVRGSGNEGKINIIPERFEQNYRYWIDGLRDWCISRQIWYGHRIPAYFDMASKKNAQGILHYKSGKIREISDKVFSDLHSKDADAMWATWPVSENENIRIINFAMASLLQSHLGISWTEIKDTASLISFHNLTDPDVKVLIDSKFVLESFVQENDTLDTWFSSGLWTFSTLGWPEKTDDLKRYHPTTVLETGRDLIFFWVARMILMSTYLLNEIPFKTVYFHGLVTDKDGKKISKSMGNNLDPLVGVGPGNDSKISLEKVKAYKLFSNKLWNIARFILSSTEGLDYDPSFSTFSKNDQAHMEKLNALVAESSREMGEFKYYLVGEKLYHYAWHELADLILEESKPIIGGFGVVGQGSAAEQLSRRQFLFTALVTILKLLHPFMPYITEEIWDALPAPRGMTKNLLMVSEWPQAK
jgi:valyl-tRNA synthetase